MSSSSAGQLGGEPAQFPVRLDQADDRRAAEVDEVGHELRAGVVPQVTPPARGGLGQPAAGSGPVAAGQGDQALDPCHPRHQRPRLIAARAPAPAPPGAPRRRPRPGGRSGPGPRRGPAAAAGGSPPPRRPVPARAIVPPRRWRPAASEISPASWRARAAIAAESIRSAMASCSRATDSASSWRPSRDRTKARAARHWNSITVMPRVAATAASAARSARSGCRPRSARTRSGSRPRRRQPAGRPGARRLRPARPPPRTREPAQPDHRHQLGVGHLCHDPVIGLGDQRGHLVQQRDRRGPDRRPPIRPRRRRAGFPPAAAAAASAGSSSQARW